MNEKDLPELRNKLQSGNREIEKLKRDIEEQESLLSLLMSDEDTAKACLQDISLMDRYQVWGHSEIIIAAQISTFLNAANLGSHHSKKFPGANPGQPGAFLHGAWLTLFLHGFPHMHIRSTNSYSGS